MDEEKEKRKKQFAALKRYLENEQARVDRDMPGATDREKTEAIVAQMSDSIAASREKKAIEKSTAVLRGKKLQRAHNQSDTYYSGGGFYHEELERLNLFADHTFRYEKCRFSAISSGSLALPPSEQKNIKEGKWAVEIHEGVPHLF